MARQTKLAVQFGTALLPLLLFAATPSHAAEMDPALCATLMGNRWSGEISSFQSGASQVTGDFATLTDALAFANRDSAMARRQATREQLSDHAEEAIDLANLAGRERSLRYASEMLAISDAMLGITKLS